MQSLLDTARVFLRTALEELQEGLEANNWVKIRDGSEKAWNAVVQATDHAMQARGRTPLPGRDAHRDRLDFLDFIGRHDLAQQYTYLAERLHGNLFYGGVTLPTDLIRRLFAEVGDFIDQTAAM
jgi:hypothetical protein